MIKMIKEFANDESGATAIEYGLIAALVALAAIGGFTAVGTSVEGAFQSIASTLTGAVPVAEEGESDPQ